MAITVYSASDKKQSSLFFVHSATLPVAKI
jgi:hypothetical protein